MSPRNVILLACGTFNPITNMHLRMFEIARDHLQALGHQRVIGGIVSPVHDEYGKKDLESSTHRCAMIRLALENCDWIRLSSWECQQEGWTRTRATLQYHQNQINAAITESSDSGGNKRARLIDGLNWMPPYAVLSSEIGQVQVKFLCGADLLESFGKPGLWNPDDVEAILSHHGLVVITREGTDPYHFIYESDLLTKYQNNIIIVNEWIRNEISSTKIRRALRRQQSAKYLIQDAVLDYILKLGLYQGISDNKYLHSNNTNSIFLTPSPSDVLMDSPSPGYDEMDGGGIGVKLIQCCGNSSSSTEIANSENTKRSGSMLKTSNSQLITSTVSTSSANTAATATVIGYPGQAVQIVAAGTERRKVSDAEPIVQIQFTKDGIKVISDKETTV